MWGTCRLIIRTGALTPVLSVDVFCVGIRGVTPPAVVQVGLDSLVIVPS